MDRFKVKVRYMNESATGRQSWLIGSGDNLAIGSIYTCQDSACDYSPQDIVDVMNQPAYGKRFVIVELVRSV